MSDPIELLNFIIENNPELFKLSKLQKGGSKFLKKGVFFWTLTALGLFTNVFVDKLDLCVKQNVSFEEVSKKNTDGILDLQNFVKEIYEKPQEFVIKYAKDITENMPTQPNQKMIGWRKMSNIEMTQVYISKNAKNVGKMMKVAMDIILQTYYDMINFGQDNASQPKMLKYEIPGKNKAELYKKLGIKDSDSRKKIINIIQDIRGNFRGDSMEFGVLEVFYNHFKEGKINEKQLLGIYVTLHKKFSIYHKEQKDNINWAGIKKPNWLCEKFYDKVKRKSFTDTQRDIQIGLFTYGMNMGRIIIGTMSKIKNIDWNINDTFFQFIAKFYSILGMDTMMTFAYFSFLLSLNIYFTTNDRNRTAADKLSRFLTGQMWSYNPEQQPQQQQQLQQPQQQRDNELNDMFDMFGNMNLIGRGKNKKNKKKIRKIRKHKGINQTTGRLKKGYRYSGKKLKSGLPQIIKKK
jgi:hypothetical protein